MLLRLLVIAALLYLVRRVLYRAPKSQPRPAGPGRTPWAILGIEPDANEEVIREAYQNMVQQYHPDKVASMGPDLRVLAELRTQEINEAYTQLRSKSPRE